MFFDTSSTYWETDAADDALLDDSDDDRGGDEVAATALSRQDRYRTVADNLRVKEVRVDDGAGRDRFVICHNPDAATRDAAVRDQIVARLSERIAGSPPASHVLTFCGSQGPGSGGGAGNASGFRFGTEARAVALLLMANALRAPETEGVTRST